MKLCTKFELNRAIRGGVVAISIFDLVGSGLRRHSCYLLTPRGICIAYAAHAQRVVSRANFEP